MRNLKCVTFISIFTPAQKIGKQSLTGHFPLQDKIGEDLLVTANGTSSTMGDTTLKVFSESCEVSEFLTHPNFVLHNDKDTADILWLYDHFKDFRFGILYLRVLECA